MTVSVPNSERCKFCSNRVRSGEALFYKKPLGGRAAQALLARSVSSNETVMTALQPPQVNENAASGSHQSLFDRRFSRGVWIYFWKKLFVIIFLA